MNLLPKITDPNQFQKIFKEDIWQPAMKVIAEKHSLKGTLTRATLGSHIVYQAGDQWIKLMAPIFSGDMAYEISGLRAVENQLSVSTPKILAEGELEDWKYVILSHVEGQAIRHVWSALDSDQKIDLTQQMAKITFEMSQCQADENIQNRYDWNPFILNQFENVFEKQKKDSLPDPWLQEVESFLSTMNKTEFQVSKPVFMHSDLTFDHFLVSSDSSPKIIGVIDLADCQMGHPEYELLAPAVFILKGNKELLRQFFLNYGLSKKQINQNLSYKFMGWTLLHRFCKMTNYFQKEMDSCRPGDFKQLALKAFPLD